ncbi:MAG: hypothetical protein U9R72_15450 [Chloroflexota bacterium]|nr:hypothetical protein [Chloroflexota bacterium]
MIPRKPFLMDAGPRPVCYTGREAGGLVGWVVAAQQGEPVVGAEAGRERRR